MEDNDSCDVDSDPLIYVGQNPVVSEQELDDGDDMCKTMDSPVLIKSIGGFTQELSSLVSREKQSDDHPLIDPQQSTESSQTIKSALPDKFCMPSKYDEDAFNFGRGGGCIWMDDDSDDEDIRVGHDGKKADTHPKNEDLVLLHVCKKRLLGDLSEIDCSTVDTAGNRNADLDSRSSSSKGTHSVSMCETLSCADVDGTCDRNTMNGFESEDLSCDLNHRTSNHDRSEETSDDSGSEELLHPIILAETSEVLIPAGDSEATLAPIKEQSSSNLEDYPKASSSCINGPEDNGAEESDHVVPMSLDSTYMYIHTSPLRRTCTGRKQAANAEYVAEKLTSESELQTISHKSKDEKFECSPATHRKSYSLRNRRRQTGLQEEMTKPKPRTPPKESQIVSYKVPETTFKEVPSPPPTRRTSPRKKNEVSHGEDHTQSKNVPLVCCNENVNSKTEEEENESLLGKDRRSTTDILNQKSSGLGSEFEVDDCEPASSQIYIGAPMFPTSETKTRKRSRRGKGSSCQTGEDATEVAEEIQRELIDTPNERVESMIPQPEHSLEEEKSNSPEQESSTSDSNQACDTGTTFTSSKVLKSSNRQRRKKRFCQDQNKTDTGKRKEQTVKRTQKANAKGKTSKKQKCFGNKSDAVIEPPQETAQVEHKEALDDLEKSEEPTPPEKRRVYRARRRCQSRGRKSVNDLINDLTAASASALKRVAESTSPPSSKENQESLPTKAKMRQASRKGKVTKDRKRKHSSCSPGEDDPQSGKDEMKASYASLEQCVTMLRPGSFYLSDNSGDDDDELINPVLTPDSKTKDLPPAFCVNDVVWALDPADKSRWPVVVIAVTGENVSRRVYNVFKTNQTEERDFQVKSSRYLKPYNCKEKKKYLEEGKEKNEFSNAVEKADNFIMKIGLGKVNSYKDFFKSSDAYLDSPPPSPDYTSPPSPPLIVGHSIPGYSPTTPRTNPHLIDDDDDEEEEVEEVEEEDQEKDRRLNDILHRDKSNYHETSKEMTKLKRKWGRKEKRLLEHMKSPQTKEYLIGIQRENTMSLRHQWFLSSKPSDKGRLLQGSFGALINEKKRFDIVDYLRDLLASDKCLLSSPRYMMEVALPEALNFAYQKTNRVDMEEAEQLIHQDGQQVIRDLDIG